MIKNFTSFFVAAFFSVAASAQTVLVEYNGNEAIPAGVELLSSDKKGAVSTTVKIHENKDAVNCISLGKSYSNSGTWSGNAIKLTCEGGFKSGDVVSITGVYNNANEKNAAVVVLTLVGDTAITVVGTTENFINARIVADDPVAQTITLTDAAEAIYLGRKGDTGTCITAFSVTRPANAGGDDDPTSINKPSADSSEAKAHKEVRDGRFVIVSGDKTYSLSGAIIK